MHTIYINIVLGNEKGKNLSEMMAAELLIFLRIN